MTNVEELIKRVANLEETVSHLTIHHDEQLVIHDDLNAADRCEHLFNLHLQPAKSKRRPSTRRKRKA
jgi:hypothetical protein